MDVPPLCPLVRTGAAKVPTVLLVVRAVAGHPEMHALLHTARGHVSCPPHPTSLGDTCHALLTIPPLVTRGMPSSLSLGATSQVAEMHALLHRWAPLKPVAALELLDAKFADAQIREYASRQISRRAPIYLPCISSASPVHLPCISRVSPAFSHLPSPPWTQVRRWVPRGPLRL